MVSKRRRRVKPHTRPSTHRNTAAPYWLRPMCVLYRFRRLLDDSLSYCFYLVGAGRFELPTPSPPDWCANQAALRSDIAHGLAASEPPVSKREAALL